MHAVPKEARRGQWVPRARARGAGELSSVDAGTRAWAFYKSGMHSLDAEPSLQPRVCLRVLVLLFLRAQLGGCDECGVSPSSPTTWAVGIELRLSILLASTFTQ